MYSSLNRLPPANPNAFSFLEPYVLSFRPIRLARPLSSCFTPIAASGPGTAIPGRYLSRLTVCYSGVPEVPLPEVEAIRFTLGLDHNLIAALYRHPVFHGMTHYRSR